MTKKKIRRGDGSRTISSIAGSRPAERDLRGLEEEWRSLAENIPDIIATVDADGTILFVNRTISGQAVDTVVGASVYEYLPSEHHHTLRESLKRVFDRGQAQSFEVAGAGPFGRTSWYLNRLGPIVRDGNVVAAALITTDITQRKRAEEALRQSEEKYRRLVQDSIDGIAIAVGAEIKFVNSALLDMFGCQSEEEMIDRPAIDFVPPGNRKVLLERNRAREQGQPVPNRYEFKAVRKDGSTFDAEASIGRVSYQGRAATQAVVRDITERKRAEEALRESEERFRHLVEDINDIIYEVDAGGGLIYVSPVVREVGGYSPSEMIGRSFTDFLHPDDVSRAMESHRMGVAGDPQPDELRFLSKSGEVHWMRSFGRPIREGDRIVGFRGVLTDITEHRRAEEALRESEERWRSVAANAPDIIMMVDADSTILFANRVVPGLTVESVIGTSLYDYLPPEHGDRQRMALERVFETGEPVSYEIAGTGPRGRTSWYFSRIGPVVRDGKVVAAILITTDITEQRRAEGALEESEERYRTLVEAAPDVIYSLSMDGTIASLNSAFESISGWSRDEWLGKSFAGLIHPDDLPAAMEDFRLAMQGEVPPTGEYHVLVKSGHYRTVETMPRPLFADGKVVGTFGVARDITERKRAEEALRDSEERYRELVELSPDATVVHSEEKILFVNSAGVQLFGAASQNQIVGRPIWDFVHPDDLRAVRKRMRGARSRRRQVNLVEEKLVRLDGQLIDVEMAAIPVTYQGGAARQVVLRDITERKRMEDALQHARDELESRVERRMRRGTPYGLTFRELTVLHLMADGRSDKEIGAVLGISTLTAQKHVENIRTKMGASSRTKASVRAVREGLLR